MEKSANVFVCLGDPILTMMKSVPQSTAYRPVARASKMDQHLTGMRRVNLLMVGADDLIEVALESLAPKLAEPVQTWSPPDPLELPAPGERGTLILRDVGAMSLVDQRRLLEWLELSAGRTRVVSTTRSRLLPLVDAGAFLDTLYYRLNIVCVDVVT